MSDVFVGIERGQRGGPGAQPDHPGRFDGYDDFILFAVFVLNEPDQMQKPVPSAGTCRVIFDSGGVHEGHLTIVEGATEPFLAHAPSSPGKTREDRIYL